MWLRPGDRNGVKVPPYSEDTMPTLWEGTSVISLRLAYRRKTTDYNQYMFGRVLNRGFMNPRVQCRRDSLHETFLSSSDRSKGS
jgi:hypothetical protein